MAKQDKLLDLVNSAHNIVVIQADNPDGDSLGSAIALEQILTGLDKEAYLYCAVDIPLHLKYLPGWSRVASDLPPNFDLSIIVDTQAASLLEKVLPERLKKLKSHPCIIIDHHESKATIDFATLIINDPKAAATGEIIYQLATKFSWKLNDEAKDMLAISILSDSLGLMSTSTTAKTIRTVADLVEGGVNLTHIDNLRRATYIKSPELTKYKGQLIERIEYYLDNRLTMLVIPWEEIEKYSPLYNPPMLVLEDMRLVENNAIAVAIKQYNDGHLTAKIRTNESYPVAAKLAEHFGGGGHAYASGIKTYDYTLNDFKKELKSYSLTLLDEAKE